MGTDRGQRVAPAGLTVLASGFGPKEPVDRLATEASGRGMAVPARGDDSAAAAKAGLELPPTEVLVFGNTRAGTPLMQAVRTIGVDLRFRAPIWQDEEGRTGLGYNDPSWVAQRHGVKTGTAGALAGMTKALAAVATRATTRDTGAEP